MNHKIARMAYKRRRKSKTNYKKRLALLRSNKTRLVVRKTNTRMIAQVVNYEHDGDKVITSATSQDLQKLGWKGSFKNIPAAYLTGKLLGKKAQDKGVKEVILDIGLHTPTKGSRVFAVAKGALDSGLKLPISKEAFPKDDRVKGSHLKNANDVKKVMEKVK